MSWTSRVSGRVGSTGAPLPPEGYAWVYEQLGPSVLMGSMSGGTDVCTAFTMSSVLLPVHAGEMQCRALGCKVESFSEDGSPLVGEVGRAGHHGADAVDAGAIPQRSGWREAARELL